jgi:hypothetical protein
MRRGGVAVALGAIGAALGAIAGSVQLAVGPDIREWVGDKQDTTRLGLTTLLLSLVALAAATFLWRRPAAPGTARLLAAAGLLIPAVLCFTTVGRLWYVPGVLLISAGLLLLSDLRREGADVHRSLARHWLAGLTVVLAGYYLFLGAVALGPAGVLGILGGLLIVIAVLTARRGSALVGHTLLVLGALPFALLTWWSVVTPLIAVLTLAIGVAALAGERARGRSRGPEVLSPDRPALGAR